MDLLDKYRNKGYVQVGTLIPEDKKQLEKLASLSSKERFQRGLELGRSIVKTVGEATVHAGHTFSPPKPNQFIKILSGETIVAFKSVTPPKPPPAEKDIPFPHQVTPPLKVKFIPQTKAQKEAAVQQYKEVLEKAGIPIEEPAPGLPRAAFDDPTSLRLVLSNQRKSALVSERGAAQAKQWGMNTIKVPYASFIGQMAKNRAYIAYFPGNAKNAKEVISILQKYPSGKRGLDYIREMGRATGTPSWQTENYIASIKQQVKTEKWFKHPQTHTGVIVVALVGGLLALMLLLPKKAITQKRVPVPEARQY